MSSPQNISGENVEEWSEQSRYVHTRRKEIEVKDLLRNQLNYKLIKRSHYMGSNTIENGGIRIMMLHP